MPGTSLPRASRVRAQDRNGAVVIDGHDSHLSVAERVELAEPLGLEAFRLHHLEHGRRDDRDEERKHDERRQQRERVEVYLETTRHVKAWRSYPRRVTVRAGRRSIRTFARIGHAIGAMQSKSMNVPNSVSRRSGGQTASYCRCALTLCWRVRDERPS